VGRWCHGERGRRAAALGRGGEMSASGRRPDAVKNSKVTRWSAAAPLLWRAFWRGRVDKMLLERTRGHEDDPGVRILCFPFNCVNSYIT
jgi:hypothetical protein